MMMMRPCLLLQALALVVFMATSSVVDAFAMVPTTPTMAGSMPRSLVVVSEANGDEHDPAEVIARRITLKGAVQGGYYRSCVLNEASRFRKLLGTMTPPDDTDEAEVYVEGKRKMVEGFIRWCQKGDVGLNQKSTVVAVVEEEPTGLYDGFYVKTKA